MADTAGLHARTVATCCQIDPMPDDAAGVRFTVLDTAESLDENRLTDVYAYPDDLPSCWVRGNMIASLDGGATTDGKSGGLGGPGDRAVFAADASTRRCRPRRRGDRQGRELLGRPLQPRPAAGPSAPRPGRGAAHRCAHQQRNARPRRQTVHPHRGAAADSHLHRCGRRRHRQARVGRRDHRRVRPSSRSRRRRVSAEGTCRPRPAARAASKAALASSAC